jgi:uncharacterized protein YrrD
VAQRSDFRLGADVISSEGHKVGTLVCVLVDEHGFDAHSIVLKHEETIFGRLLAAEKLLITDELVIPISDVESAQHHLVRLSISAPEVRRMPPYISYRFKPVTAGEALLQEAAILGGGIATPNVEEVANKPEGEIEIDRGENVMLGKSGHRLGRIHDLLYHQGELIGVVIRPDGFSEHDVVLPIRFVSRGDDMALFAAMEPSDIEHLTTFVDAE